MSGEIIKGLNLADRLRNNIISEDEAVNEQKKHTGTIVARDGHKYQVQFDSGKMEFGSLAEMVEWVNRNTGLIYDQTESGERTLFQGQRVAEILEQQK